MALEISSLSELNDEDVSQSLALLTAMLSEQNTQGDFRFGVFQSLLLHPAAQFHAANRELADRISRSSTLQGIADDPTLADPEIVDAVLGTRGLSRRSGDSATGVITIVVSRLAPVTIAKGARFTASGQSYNADAAYTAQTSAGNVSSDTDRVLVQLADGNYAFSISVTATSTGSSAMLRKGDLLVATTAIASLVKIYAASDFQGGVDQETTAELLAREQEGVACRAMSNRVSMTSMLRAGDYGGFVASSIVGFGDAEMLRDRHSILPISFGGRVDWYLRYAALPQAVTLTKEATLIAKTTDNRGTWQINMIRSDAPGFYDVLSVRREADADAEGTYAISLDRRSFDMTAIPGELMPDVTSGVEAAYSRFQTATIQFLDTDTDTTALTVGAKADYQITVRQQSYLSEIQTVAADRLLRFSAGDVLVKAAVPCFVSLAFTLYGKAGSSLPDQEAIKTALAAYVNSLGFGNRLFAPRLSDVIYGYLGTDVHCGAVDMFGQVLGPDGVVRSLRSSEALVIPDDPANMVSSRTTVFYLEPSKIFISAEATDIDESA